VAADKSEIQKNFSLIENMQQQSKLGIIAFVISMIATVASIRALMFINFGIHSPTEATIYHWAVILSLGLPFVSLILGILGNREQEKSNVLGAIAIGVSLFLMTSLGFAYLLSTLFSHP